MVNVEFDGLNELLSRLDRMPNKIETVVMRSALRKAAAVYITQLKANIDSLPISDDYKARLKKNLIVRPFKNRRGRPLAFGVRLVPPKDKKGFEWGWWMFEYGTKERFRKTSSRTASTGSITATPFVRPALMQAQEAANQVSQEEAAKKLREELEKL